MSRWSVVWTVVLVLLSATPAFAQAPEPPSEPESPAGRTERQPRRETTNETPDEVTAGDRAQDEELDPTNPPSGLESGVRPPVASGIARSKVLSHVDTDERIVALTLDDGYQPDPWVLDLIATYHLRGTAFLVGQVADTDPELLRQLVRLGWMVCSHTYDHKRLTTLDSWQIRKEIVRGLDAVERVVGYRCPYFRAPYGSVDSRVAAVTDSLGLKLVGWDASISDSAPRGTDPNKQVGIALRTLRPGSILLGHFGGTNSYVVLKTVIEWLLESGYRVGSLQQVIAGDVPRATISALPRLDRAGPPGGEGRVGHVLASRPSAHWTSDLNGSVGLPLGVMAILLTRSVVRSPRVRRRRFGRRARQKLTRAEIAMLRGIVAPEGGRVSP